MLLQFGLEELALQPIAAIIHKLNLRDRLYSSPEATGVETIIRGWLLAGVCDPELEARSYKLFEGLYLAFFQLRNKM